MEIKKISLQSDTSALLSQRPTSFSQFVGQEPIKSVLATAIDSTQKDPKIPQNRSLSTKMRIFCMIKTKIGASIQKLRAQKSGGVSL